MNKKKEKIITWSVIIVVAAFIILAATGFEFKTFAVSGTNTLSLSQANLQSSNPYLSGKVWVLTFSAGGLGQSYTGTFDSSDVQQATSDTSTTTKDFTINVDYADQTWNYPIQSTSLNKAIYDISSITWTYIPLIDPCTEAEAKGRGLSNILYVVKPTGITCYGIGWNTQSPVGDIQNPTLQSSYTITITTPSGSSSKTLDINGGSSQGAIGNYAYASWLGNLGSGLTFPSQAGYKTAYVNGVWRVIGSSSYNNYIAQVNSVPPSTVDGLNVWINNLKDAANNAKVSRSFGTLNSATSLSSAIIKITSTTPVQFPVTTLYIKASEIGIYTPTPDFRIDSSDSQCFKTGEQGAISVIVKNYGESGTGNVYAKCNAPFQVTQNTQLSLTNGESRTILLPLSASANQKTTGSCTVYVESPGGTKSGTANTCVDPQITCEANKKFCAVSGVAEVVKQCSSDGATSSIIQICSTGETCDIDKCVVNGGGGGKPGLFSKIGDFFKNLFGGVFDFFRILRMVVALVIGIFATLFGKDLLDNFKALRKNKAAQWIIAIVLGIGFLILAFKIFWVGVITFVVFTIIKFVMPGR